MESANPMDARQRRMELRRQSTSKSIPNRCHEDDTIDHEDEDDRSFSSSTSKDISTASSCSVIDSKKTNKKHKGGLLDVASSNTEIDVSIYRGIKKQARYEPTIPISSKAELAAWRKEARRIRNRESAAASRNKTRERIDELEGQLGTIQNQYSTALQRIVELESLLAKNSKTEHVQSLPQVSSLIDSTTIHVSPTLPPSKPTEIPTALSISSTVVNDIDSADEAELLIWSPDHQSAAEALANSLMYDITASDNMSTPNVVAPDPILQWSPSTNVQRIASSYGNNAMNATHQNIKISRPTAVCVVPI